MNTYRIPHLFFVVAITTTLIGMEEKGCQTTPPPKTGKLGRAPESPDLPSIEPPTQWPIPGIHKLAREYDLPSIQTLNPKIRKK